MVLMVQQDLLVQMVLMVQLDLLVQTVLMVQLDQLALLENQTLVHSY
jgi:hypothetical protein